MRQRLAASNRLTWFSAALCLAAAGFLGWQLWRTEDAALVSTVQSVDQAQPAQGEQQLASFELPGAEEYEDIRLRPLFNRSRRPDAPQEIPQAGGDGSDSKGTPAAQISLNGVVLTRDRRVALLRLDNDPKVMHVAEGQRAGGWLIEAVRPDRIVLRRGDTASEVALDYKRRDGEGGAQVGAGEGVPNSDIPSDEQDEASE
jgi:hypothetical protein